MTTWADLFTRLSIFIGVVILSFLILALSDNIFILFPIVPVPVIVYLIVLKKLKDKKRAGVLLKGAFASLNYSILSERPLTFREQYENYEWDFGFNYLKGISTNSWLYKAKMLRHFVVRNEKGYDFELIVTIVQTWSDKIIYNIDSTSRIRN